MADDQMVNDYEAAVIIEDFRQRYIQRIEKGLSENAFKPNHIATMQNRLKDYSALIAAVDKLVLQHEKLVTKLSDLYARWYNDVAHEGVQPSEMMQAQAEILQQIFLSVYNLLDPLNLPIEKPGKTS